MLLQLRLIFGGDGDKARAKHRAGSEEAVVADADRGEVATDGHVFFHDALCILFEEGREGRGEGGGVREGPKEKKRRRSRIRRGQRKRTEGGKRDKGVNILVHASPHTVVLRLGPCD